MSGFSLRMVGAGGETLPCVVRGAGGPRRLLLLAPLFEEMNRTRRLLALTGNALAAAGVETWLPDLPGTGDHADCTPQAMDWARWRAAVAALGELLETPPSLAVRGGALLDDAAGAQPRFRLAPVSGAALLRDLLRARAASEAEAGRGTSVAELEAQLAAGTPVEAAGYVLTPSLAAALRAAQPAPERQGDRTAVVSDATVAGAELPGPPPWRSADAGAPTALATALAGGVVAWLSSLSS